jgi:dephospho-CoA kinase
MMKVIGITGGIGCGKSAILAHIAFTWRCKVILADEVAHIVKEPEQICYQPLIELLGEAVLDQDGYIDKSKMATMIFADEHLRMAVNNIIHPAVKIYIKTIIAEEIEKDRLDFLFVEAALLIEDGYANIVDELWYIHADPMARRQRLRSSRDYTDAKIDAIMGLQLTEEDFRRHCQVEIDNNGHLEDAYAKVDEKLGEYLCQKKENILKN